jgi:nucleoside 2-deoxyribosyltransferase
MGSNDHEKMVRSIYVAGASDEIETCRAWMARLREAGLRVTSTWPEKIAAEKTPDAGLSIIMRRRYALGDFAEVDQADILWLIVPTRPHSKGAWIELGYAIAQGTHIVISGASRGCIFASMADVLCESYGPSFTADHQAAFKAIVQKWGPR